ncbi:MAG: hypothetical protein ACQKBT_08615 [Puniceicoccales bacterium]
MKIKMIVLSIAAALGSGCSAFGQIGIGIDLVGWDTVEERTISGLCSTIARGVCYHPTTHPEPIGVGNPEFMPVKSTTHRTLVLSGRAT